MSEAALSADSGPVKSARRRWIRLAIIVGIVGAVGIGLYSASAMYWAVRDLRHGAEALEAGVQAADPGAVRDSLNGLTKSAAEVSRVSESFPWSIAAKLPFVGATVSGLSAMSDSIGPVTGAAAPVVALAANGTTNTERLAALVGSHDELEALASAAKAAQATMADVNPDDLLFNLSSVAQKYKDALPTVVDRAESAAKAVGYLPGLLGSNERRTWLVLLQNPAEARGSGGLFSGYALVEVNNGQPTILEAQTRKRALDEFDIPYIGAVPTDVSDLWGPALGMWASFNLSADFPTVAKLASAGMAARDSPVDGVIAVDAYAVQAILAGTGSVEHRGVTIDGTNAAAFFTKDLYAKYPDFPDVEAKDELALGLVYATIDSLLKRPLNLSELIDTIPPIVEAGHVKVWSPDASEEAWLTDVGLGGDIASRDPATALVALNNSTGGKLDAYVTPSITYIVGICKVESGPAMGNRRSAIEVELTNNAPSGLPDYVDVRLDNPDAPSGSTRLQTYLYGPAGSALRQIYLDDIYPPIAFGTEAGRPVWGTGVELLQGQSSTATFIFDEPDVAVPDPAVVLPGSAIPATVTVKQVNSTEACPEAAEDLPTREELAALAS